MPVNVSIEDIFAEEFCEVVWRSIGSREWAGQTVPVDQHHKCGMFKDHIDRDPNSKHVCRGCGEEKV